MTNINNIQANPKQATILVQTLWPLFFSAVQTLTMQQRKKIYNKKNGKTLKCHIHKNVSMPASKQP